MNCPLKSIIKPHSAEISYENYFAYCKSVLSSPERFTELKGFLLDKFGLAYAQNISTNTCMAQVSEVRPEYREHYHPEELFYYLLHQYNSLSSEKLGQGKVLLPDSVGDFWHSVASGKLLEEIYLSEKA
ncbi:hypothetical protein [Pleomorphovibrio marinus]|uniref:hypothetical protein n=1 Tax=Pleomorphovibrio marinus TaxID=2164132 RepID=UPI000E0AA6E8|nr:hypothetical protein [Pleomorphovibrio marinus]